MNIFTLSEAILEIDERICILSNKGKVEDEFHFMLICPHYITIRHQFVKSYYCVRPSMLKFIQLLNTQNGTLAARKSLEIYAFIERTSFSHYTNGISN